MNTEQFCAPPLTTGALQAHFERYGQSAPTTDVTLVHFLQSEEVSCWQSGELLATVVPQARAALAAGVEPVFGFSCYTWNVAELLALARRIRELIPAALLIGGGPHVQRAEDFLDDFDLIVLGEGELTFTELLDCRDRSEWSQVPGCAYLDNGSVRRTTERPRLTELDVLPSALDVIELRAPDGKPRYLHAAYETSRGCPYRCSFCEWGTGAIGTKMYQFSLDRIRRDLELLVAGGIQDIWLCDSNFGALREDRAKAEIIVELKQRTGSPHTFATSWSKNHNRRVQEIVRLLHRNGLLWHYHLALQTLTPRALELCHRENMRANEYEPVVKALAAEGVPVACELIWGLPGDTLAEFEANLEHLLTVFPRINIFGYTLLPGTEFYERRAEYQLETIPVAGYGKAKGEYVVGCHTFPRREGEEGYFLVTAYLLLGRGQLMAATVPYLALQRQLPVAALLRAVLRALLHELGEPDDPMTVYESRAALYLRLLREPQRSYSVIRQVVSRWLAEQGRADLASRVLQVLEIDAARCPTVGAKRTDVVRFAFAADEIAAALAALDLPSDELFSPARAVELEVSHPGHVGEVLLDPDGGEWMRGQLSRPPARHAAPPATPTSLAAAVAAS